jgi:exodeoxyribonuclease-3
VFREKYPDTRKYSWWSYYSRGRENNRGWRIDYWLASPSLMPYIRDIEIMNDVFGSDHCPVLLKTKRIPAGLEA